MRINQLKVAVRPRHPYEAADLGVLLWQTGGAGLYKAWLWLMLPLTVAMIVLEHLPGPRLALLVLWWLKPLLDYLVLWQLSRRVFGDEPTPWQSLRVLPGFLGKHDEVAASTWKLPAVKSAANCGACHTTADQGDFNENKIRIPR